MVAPAMKMNPPPEFDRLLAQLEVEVGIPVVAGDARKWCESVLAVLREIDVEWQQHVTENRKTLTQTLKTDVELANRVDKLAQKEAELTNHLDLLGRQTRVLLDRAQQAEGGEEPTKAVEELREGWLAWIVSCRAVTKEIQTWFLEANYRDVGGGD
jgi:hypothetical protein